MFTFKKIVKKLNKNFKTIKKIKLLKSKNILDKNSRTQWDYPDFTIIEDIDSYQNEFLSKSVEDVGVYEEITYLSPKFRGNYTNYYLHCSVNMTSGYEDYEIIEYKC